MGNKPFQSIIKAQTDAIKSVAEQSKKQLQAITSAAEKSLRPEAAPKQPKPEAAGSGAQTVKPPTYATPTAINRSDAQVTAPKPPSPPKAEPVTPKPPASTYLTGGTTAPDTPYAPGLQAQRQTGAKETEQPHILPQATAIQQEKRWVAKELGKESTLRSAIKSGDMLMETGAPKAPITVKPSEYLTGGKATIDTPYAAGLQAQQQAQAQRPPVTAAPVGVDAQTRVEHSRQIQQVIPRAVQLVGRSGLLTNAEKEELKEADRAIRQYLGDTGKYIHHTDKEWEQIAPLYELHQAISRRTQTPDAVSTGLTGTVTALPGMGAGIRWAERMDRKSAQGKASEYDYLPQNYNTLDYMRAEHPTAFAVGQGVGNLGVMLAGGAWLKGSKLFASLSPLGQSVMSGGTMMGVTGANNALTAGEPLDQAVVAGAINTMAGMAGGAASYAASQVGNAFLESRIAQRLFGKGVETSTMANAVNQGVSGAAFAGANTGTKAFLDPDYAPTPAEVAVDAVSAFLFSTIASAISTHATSKATKEQLDYELAVAKEDYAKIIQANQNGLATDGETLVSLEVRTELLRRVLNNNQYIGQGKEVKAALEALDWIDDQINLTWQNQTGNVISVEPNAFPANTGTEGLALSTGPLPASTQASKAGNTESPSTISHVLAVVQQANAIAKAKWKTPDWVPQSVRDAVKGITDLNLAAAKRNALGDLLGYSREVQKNIPRFLDKLLADAEDIARWEAMPPETRQAFQPELEEKKESLQWLEERLAKMEGADEQQNGEIEESPNQDERVFTGSEQDSIIKEIEEFSRTLHKSVDLDVDHIMEQAKTGKVHRGVYNDALTKNYRQLKKSIASRVAQVEEHIKKLQTPERYDVGWSTKNEVQKAGLLRKWRKDMQRNAEQAFIEIYIWKERFGNEH